LEECILAARFQDGGQRGPAKDHGIVCLWARGTKLGRGATTDGGIQWLYRDGRSPDRPGGVRRKLVPSEFLHRQDGGRAMTRKPFVWGVGLAAWLAATRGVLTLGELPGGPAPCLLEGPWG